MADAYGNSGPRDDELEEDRLDFGGAIRRLFPTPVDVEAQLRASRERLGGLAGVPGAEFGSALVEVMTLAHGWAMQSVEDPEATITPAEAADAVIAAVTRGLSQ